MSSRAISQPLPTPRLATPTRSETASRAVLSAVVGTLAIATAAHVAVPLPFTSVPLILTPFAVLLAGLLLGPALGCATLLLYLAEGALGLPVFSPLGPGGLLQLLGPSGGFLLAYPVVALLAGGVFRALRLKSRYGAAAIACTVAVVFLFSAGAAWFAITMHAGLRTTLVSTVLPFLPGEAVKILAAAGIASALRARPSTR